MPCVAGEGSRWPKMTEIIFKSGRDQLYGRRRNAPLKNVQHRLLSHILPLICRVGAISMAAWSGGLLPVPRDGVDLPRAVARIRLVGWSLAGRAFVLSDPWRLFKKPPCGNLRAATFTLLLGSFHAGWTRRSCVLAGVALVLFASISLYSVSFRSSTPAPRKCATTIWDSTI